jgi:hypothetical protein
MDGTSQAGAAVLRDQAQLGNQYNPQVGAPKIYLRKTHSYLNS